MHTGASTLAPVYKPTWTDKVCILWDAESSGGAMTAVPLRAPGRPFLSEDKPEPLPPWPLQQPQMMRVLKGLHPSPLQGESAVS
jgi:hypothetical protein